MVTIDITSLLDFFKDQLHDLLTGIKDEGDHFFKGELKSYLVSQKEKFFKTKTFLHRHDTIEFEKVYFPISLRSSFSSKIIVSDLKGFFSSKNFATVIGQAGSGKSMLMKKIFLNCLTQKFKIPIFLELRQLNHFDEGLESYIKSKLLKNDLSPSDRILSRMLKAGSFLFILDGYDELFSARKEILTYELNTFVDIYNKNSYILTSRPGANIDLLPRFSNHFVNKLDDSEILKFISLQISVYENKSGTELVERITETIQKSENKSYKIYLKNPLLLSMFILTYESSPEVPKRRSTFYSNVYNALCIQHNSISKLGYTHEKKSQLSNDEIEEVLQIFSFSTYFQGENAFTHASLKKHLNKIDRNIKFDLNFESDLLIQDLTVAIPIIIKDGIEYKFLHRSLQEYFAAKFISNLEKPQKEIIYTKKIKNLTLQGTDSFNNFWSLCRDLDKNSFLENFVLESLESFKNRIDTTTDKKIIESILGVIDLEIDVEFYTFRESDHHGRLLISSVDHEGGVVSSSNWSDEFNYYKNIFRFLGFFKMYKLTESISPEILFDESKDTKACIELEKFIGDEKAKVYKIRFNHIHNLNSIIQGTDFQHELIKLNESIDENIVKIKEEISQGIGFNDDIINELID